MGYNYIMSMLDEDDKKLLQSVSQDSFDKPYLIAKLLDILDDDSNFSHLIKADNKIRYFRLLKEYFNKCWGYYIDSSIGQVKLDKLMEYNISTIYYVDAPNGKRVATKGEIDNGVAELLPEFTKVLGEEVDANVNILLWTFTGRLRYYGAAGLKYTYENGKLVESDLQIVFQAGKLLRQMIDWAETPANYERAIAILKQAKKNSKSYTYPSYAKDEIKTNISTKQIVYLCTNKLFGRGNTEIQAEASKILFKIKKSSYVPLPHDIAVLRKAYSELESIDTTETSKGLSDEVTELCDKIEQGVKTGLVNKSAFALKIVDSVRRFGKCSPKQLDILKEEEKKIDQQIRTKVYDKYAEENKDKSVDEELFNLSDALGSGTLNIFDTDNDDSTNKQVSNDKSFNPFDDDDDDTDADDLGFSII